MKFKIEKGTATYDALTTLFEEVVRCRKEASDLAQEFGATQWCEGSSPFSLGGGLSALKLEEKPKGWHKAYYEGCYYPSPRSKHSEEARKRLELLPIVPTAKLCDILGFEAQDLYVKGGRGFIMYTFPATYKGKDCFLFEVREDAVYEPKSDDIIEITFSEFTRLKEEK